ncbi:MAG: 1,4-alpha-glucan branching protein GlgB [Gammaproteobacteria bacterium]|nr:1,4-alpha-glucan branching protein GlgB [Gammaproteobacteria bacterium]MDH5591231.1 1,4-alpha-glucan branching protein GlgB [Gammaproteobacteria bacterium]
MVLLNKLSENLIKIIEARHHDPFDVLGAHPDGDKITVTVFLPDTQKAWLNDDLSLARIEGTDLFQWTGVAQLLHLPYKIHRITGENTTVSQFDPYCFLPQISEFDLHLFSEGRHWHAYRILGAHQHQIDGVDGTLFATWAPSAQRVSVVGDFNQWDGRCHPMRVRGGSGVWELFIPDITAGDLYKFEIKNHADGSLHSKMDPYARQAELRPGTASVVAADSKHLWQDDDWMSKRETADWLHQPHSVYEVHLGSWKRNQAGEFLSYRDMADQLVPYVKELGFTHIELLPVTEHPLDISWGYQTTGYFSPTSRFGAPDDFRYFIDRCHQNNIGVILDWVPGHFPKDAHGLARFDGSALYEHADPRQGEHQDWGTLIFNYGRSEVTNFLLSSAFYWLEEFHIDGLRVDAVASMLYLDYSREEGQWIPNEFGGRENLEVIEFLKHMNSVLHQEHPGCLITAEESTSYPMVSRPAHMGGLGFSMKWNMGWMHDILQYMQQDTIHRQYHHDSLTFGLLYAFTENFVLPFSHDEVVHGKKSMINKMPGDEWQRFANLRLLYTFMFTYPGKKLLFMGSEFAQGSEWNSETALDWYVLDYPPHQGMKTLVSDLNKLYTNTPALYRHEFDPHGFEWLDCNDRQHSILSYIRKEEDDYVISIFNFTPVPREKYRIGVPELTDYHIILNSDSKFYGGSNFTNKPILKAEPTPWSDKPYSIELNLPPLSGMVVKKS